MNLFIEHHRQSIRFQYSRFDRMLLNRRSASDDLQRLALVELTPAGRLEAARRLLINAALDRRRHGVIDSHTTGR